MRTSGRNTLSIILEKTPISLISRRREHMAHTEITSIYVEGKNSGITVINSFGKD